MQNRMFPALVTIFSATVAVYTVVVIGREGLNLFAVFLGNMMAWNWSGQFNLDFLTYLLLSGLWVAWREGFSIRGWALGALASVLGIVFFGPLLLLWWWQANGRMDRVLLGTRS